METDKRHDIYWALLFILGAILFFWGITAETLWFDETHTVALIGHGFLEIPHLLASDAHPPLYFLLLKIFTSIVGTSELALRSFSAVGGLALASLGFWLVRRLLGEITGWLYSFLIFTIPVYTIMAQDARMYTWAAFFVALCALSGYIAVKEGQLKDWVLFSFAGLAAAYTHNYGLLAMAILYLMLLAYVIVRKRGTLKLLLISGVVTAVGYLPWFITLLSQVQIQNETGFWIPPVKWRLVQMVAINLFGNHFSYPVEWREETIFFLVVAVILLVGLVILWVRKDESRQFATFILGGYFGTFAVAILISFLARPILYPRYIFIVTPFLMLSLAASIAAFKNKFLIAALCLVMVGISIPQHRYTRTELENTDMTAIQEYLEPRLQPGDGFLFSSKFGFGMFSYYFPEYDRFLFLPEDALWDANYNIFAPDGDFGPSYQEFFDHHERVFLVEHITQEDTIPPEALFSYSQMRSVGDRETFESPASWLTLTVRLFKKDERIELQPLELYSLEIEVTGLRSDDGQIYSVIVPADAPAYDLGAHALIVQEDKISKGTAIAKMRYLAPGEYKVFVFHDENDNSIFDMAAGNTNKPGEGYLLTLPFSIPILTSRDLGTNVQLGADNTMTIEVNYLD